MGRSFSRAHVYLTCALVHFFLILAVCCRDTTWLLAEGYTLVPHSFDTYWRRIEALPTIALAQDLAVTNPLRRAVMTYLHGAGVENGYGFFAPNVPSNYKLVFELHYADGRVEYVLPRVSGAAAGLRLNSLLNYIGRTHYDSLREALVKMMTYSIWQKHPDAMMIRAVFGFVRLPSMMDFAHGASESYEVLYAYDFGFGSPSSRDPRP